MITPNRLTYFRIVLAFFCPFLLLLNRSVAMDYWVMFFFTLACVTDWWDGYLARKYSMVTGVGKLLDPIADKVLILGLMLVFVYLGLYSFVWIFFILVREVAVTCTRLIRLQKGKVIPAEWVGKVKVGFQITSVSISLIVLTYLDAHSEEPLPDFFSLLNFAHYGAIFLANFFTITSGFLFFKRLARND